MVIVPRKGYKLLFKKNPLLLEEKQMMKRKRGIFKFNC